jgi:hypothetical protein
MILQAPLSRPPRSFPRAQNQSGTADQRCGWPEFAASRHFVCVPVLVTGRSRSVLREMRIHPVDFAGRKGLNNRGPRR